MNRRPSPTGPYAVGTATYTVYTDREELRAPGTKRSVPVRIYYPASKASVVGLNKARYMSRNVAEGLGNLCVLKTRAMLGLMNLVTVVATPGSGKNVPFLLIDTMDMGKKHLCYVEYYDCTADGADKDLLLAASAPYADVADYAEKPAWYVKERMAGSLIKTGDKARLEQMALDALKAYAAQAAAPVKAGNIAGLQAFQQRMVKEGNPSTAALTKTLGREGAEEFFRTVVMPVQ